MGLLDLGAALLKKGKGLLGAVTGATQAELVALQVAGIIADEVKRNVPQLEDEVVVEIMGQPGATKHELYLLALATAFGVVRRFQPLVQDNPLLPPTAGMLMIEYDAADQWVRCTLRYQASAAAANVETGAKKGKDFIDTAAVYRGPMCEVVGGTFDFMDTGGIGGAIAGILPIGVPSEAKAPNLPFAGRPILTSCPTTYDPTPNNAIMPAPLKSESVDPIVIAKGTKPSLNPMPPGDNRSRGAVVVSPDSNAPPPRDGDKCCPKQLDLVGLIFTALTDPGSGNNEVWPRPITGMGGLG